MTSPSLPPLPTGPEPSTPLPTDPTLAPAIAIPTNSVDKTSAKKTPSIIPLDDTRKFLYRMPGVELMATNNPHAFMQVMMDPITHYPPQRIINAVDNDLFAQCWKDRICKLVVDYLQVTLPVSWCLDIVRRGFMVHGRDDPSVTPHVLKIGIGREVEITEQKASEIVEVLAELISSHWSGEVVYVEVCRPDWRALESCATASNTPFVSGSTSSQTLPFHGPESSSSSSIGQMRDKSKSFDETVSTDLQATPEVRPK